MGKGSKPRPTDMERYGSNKFWDLVEYRRAVDRWRRDGEEYPPPEPQTAEQYLYLNKKAAQ